MTAPFLFFFASGACALIYQVIWIRRLLLIVGTTTAAVSTVLSVFMADVEELAAWRTLKSQESLADVQHHWGLGSDAKEDANPRRGSYSNIPRP